MIRWLLLFFGIWKRYVSVDFANNKMVVCIIVRKHNGNLQVEKINVINDNGKGKIM